MLCAVCNHQTKKQFKTLILNKYNVDYFFCPNCHFLQTEKPYWLDEAYAHAIAPADTGIMLRNNTMAALSSALIFSFFDHTKKFLDFAGGHGIFVRLMRDLGYDFYWSDAYAQNLFAQGFEHKQDHNTYELVTSFECLEHLSNPQETFDELFSYAPSILVSTDLLPHPIPHPDAWWYYAREYGQHIAFYSHKTLTFIANHYKKQLYSFGNIHVFTDKKINTFLFNNVVKYARKKMVQQWISKRLTSKTMQDMHYIVKQSHKNNALL